MTYFIRHIPSGDYFKSGAWVNTKAEGQGFRTLKEVLTVCKAFRLDDVETIAIENGEETVIRIPNVVLQEH
jgi:hypothetical protein